jgi:hypothetical protein
MYSVSVQGQQYSVRQLHCSDYQRQRDYQRLRAKIFVEQFGWQIPVDSKGRERDRYDEMDDSLVRVCCVYGRGYYRKAECLLGGVRTLILRDWEDSMTMNEFHTIGMIPTSVVRSLEQAYNPAHLLEITRLCLRRGRLYRPGWAGYNSAQFHLGIARDLVYASVYALVEETDRRFGLCIVDQYYLKVMKISNFIFDELYKREEGVRGGYSLVVIDLFGTINSMERAGMYDRARRMLMLCSQSDNLLSNSCR